MEQYLSIKSVIGSILYSVIGLGVFIFGIWLFDKLPPGALWKEILEEHNTALAIIVGSVAIGISLIVSAAIHG